MLRHSWLVVAVLCSVMVACSGSDPNSNGSGSELSGDVNAVGEVAIPLTATNNGISYQLASARFTISGAPLGKKTKIVTPPADEPVHTETLLVGSYAIVLEDGWQLMAQGPSDTAFAPVDAALVSPNPAAFSVKRDLSTDVVFRFTTAAGVVVAIDRGQVNIRIDVSDCSAYDQFTAALATFTVDCLGTIGPDSFILDAAGFMRRNFDRCPLDQSKLQSINDLLGLQYRKNLLPIGKQCIEGRWSMWKRSFLQSGITVCPTWKKTGEFNAPDGDTLEKLATTFPKLPAPDTRDRPPVIQQLKTSAAYSIAFDQVPPVQDCGSPAACAARCAGGLPGFVLRASDNLVLTDPTYWLLDTVFAPNPDPFMRMGYYHPMSYYGPLPGTIVGHRNRALMGSAEMCSWYNPDAGIHFQIPLQLNCVDITDYTSCISLCLP